MFAFLNYKHRVPNMFVVSVPAILMKFSVRIRVKSLIEENSNISVNTTNCNSQPANPVCDTDGWTHANPCDLVMRARLLAYWGPCLQKCSSVSTTYYQFCIEFGNVIISILLNMLFILPDDKSLWRQRRYLLLRMCSVG